MLCIRIIALIVAVFLVGEILPAYGLEGSVSFSQPDLTGEPFDVNEPISYNISVDVSDTPYPLKYDISLEVGTDDKSASSQIYRDSFYLSPKSHQKNIIFSVNFSSPELATGKFSKWLNNSEPDAWKSSWYRLNLSRCIHFGTDNKTFLLEKKGQPALIKPSISYLKPVVSEHEVANQTVYDYQISVKSNFAGRISLEVASSRDGPWSNLGCQDLTIVGTPQTLKWVNKTLNFDITSAYYRFICIEPSELFKGPKLNFERIDKHASNVPESQEKAVDSLASYLTSPARDDREKVRAIYYWVTHNINYNIEGLLRDNYGDLSPEGVLKSRKSVCSGYSDLFDSLARASGLEVATINGYAKGYDYVPGMTFTGRPTDHAWNAVRLNGTWYLLDTTWGAGYVNNRKFVREFDEHYFLTPPEEFIYDHFPDDPKWQLSDKPKSLEDFENLVYLKPDFFNLGLCLGNQINGTINCRGTTDITISVPKNVFLMADLDYGDKKSSVKSPTIKRRGNLCDIHADLPAEGSYLLSIFGRQGSEYGDYDEVLEYKINSNRT